MMRYLLLFAVATAAHGQFGAATSVVSGNGAPIAAQCTNANNVGRVWARKDGGAASTTFYICAATGAGTYGWQLNDGAIGGAGNVASGQVLYGTAAGVAGSNTNFRYFVSTGNMVVGTTSDDGTNRLQVAGSVRLAAAGSREILMKDTNGSVEMQILVDTGSLNLGVKNVTNLWSLNSGGTNTVYNATPTTGVTQLIVRAGAGQSTTGLFAIQNSANSVQFFGINADSTMVGNNGSANYALNPQTGMALPSGFVVAWANSTNGSGGTKDASLSRAGDKVLQVGDGGANANGIVSAAGYRMALTTPASASATGTTGTMVWDADYVYVCTATNTWKRAAIATW